MRYSKVFLFVFLIALFTTSFAYDTQGKFGMGVRFWGTPLVTFSTIQYGLTNDIGIEPTLGYFRFSTTTNDKTTAGTTEDKTATTVFDLGGTLDWKVIKAKQSNFVLKGGLLWGLLTNSDKLTEPDAPTSESSSTSSMFSLLAGAGIEHFFTDHFAVNVGIMSGFVLISGDSDKSSWTDNFAAHFGSQLVDFALVWYLK